MLERTRPSIALALRKVVAVGVATAINIALWAYGVRFLDRLVRPTERLLWVLLPASYCVFVALLSVVPSGLAWGWRRVGTVLLDGFIAFVIFYVAAILLGPKTVA
jgi:hypothetical protein